MNRASSHDDIREAEDPSTRPERLAEIASTGARAERRAVAANPNAPIATLFSLMREHGAVVAQNPALPLHLLLEPAALGRLSPSDAAKLVAGSPPSAVLVALSRAHSQAHRELVARAPGCPADLLARLLEDRGSSVRKAASEHPDAPAERLRFLLRCGATYGRPRVVDPTVTAAELDELSRSSAYGLLLAAMHPSTAPSTLRSLAQHRDDDVRAHVALNRALRPGLYWQLSRDRSDRVRAAVAENSSTPRPVLRRLLPDSRSGAGLARNPSSPAAVLAAIAARGQPWELRVLASNPSVPAALLPPLLTSSEREVRGVAAANPRAPAELLALLARAGATETLGPPAEGARAKVSEGDALALSQLGVFARSLVARLEEPPEQLQRALAGDESDSVRVEVAGNPRTPPDVLERLLGDEVDGVKAAAFGNASTPPPALSAAFGAGCGLAQARALVRNPACPADVLASMAAGRPAAFPIEILVHVCTHSHVSADTLGELAEHPRHEVRAAAAANPLTPPERLEPLVADLTAQIAVGLLRNPCLPPRLAEHLSVCDLPVARARAAQHPALAPEALQRLRAAGAAHDLRFFDEATGPLDADTRSWLLSFGTSYAAALVALHPSTTTSERATFAPPDVEALVADDPRFAAAGDERDLAWLERCFLVGHGHRAPELEPDERPALRGFRFYRAVTRSPAPVVAVRGRTVLMGQAGVPQLIEQAGADALDAAGWAEQVAWFIDPSSSVDEGSERIDLSARELTFSARLYKARLEVLVRWGARGEIKLSPQGASQPI